MKAFLIAVLAIAFTCIMAGSSFAAVTNQTAQTAASVSVGSVFSLSFASTTATASNPKPPRSSTDVIFTTVDGTAPNGWYYNSLAALDAAGDPSDGKSDVGLVCKSNAHSSTLHYTVTIKKSADALDEMLGYEVGGAFDAGAATATASDGTVTYPSGFKGTTGTGKDGWGVLATSATTMYTSGTKMYSVHGVLIPLSFALVPDNLAASATPYSTTITYTMTTPV